MSTASTMIDVATAPPRIDTLLYGDTIDALVEAARTATQCAHACMLDERPAQCVNLCLDAAAICSATSDVVVRLADHGAAAAVLQAARVVLQACAEECRRHSGHLRSCAVCAEVCERTEEQCHRLEVALTRETAAA